METAALGFIRGGSSRHILISTKPISEAFRRNRRGCWRLLPYLSVPKIEEMFNAGFGFAACACAAPRGISAARPPRLRPRGAWPGQARAPRRRSGGGRILLVYAACRRLCEQYQPEEVGGLSPANLLVLGAGQWHPRLLKPCLILVP